MSHQLHNNLESLNNEIRELQETLDYMDSLLATYIGTEFGTIAEDKTGIPDIPTVVRNVAGVLQRKGIKVSQQVLETQTYTPSEHTTAVKDLLEQICFCVAGEITVHETRIDVSQFHELTTIDIEFVSSGDVVPPSSLVEFLESFHSSKSKLSIQVCTNTKRHHLSISIVLRFPGSSIRCRKRKE